MNRTVTGPYLRARFWIASLILMAALGAAAGVSVIALRAQEDRSQYALALQHLGDAVERFEDELDHLAVQSDRGVASRHAARSAFKTVLAEFRGLVLASRGPGGAMQPTGGAAAGGEQRDIAERFGIDGAEIRARRDLEFGRMPVEVARIWVPGSGAPEAGPSENLEYVIDRLLRIAEPLVRGAGPLSAAERDRVVMIKSSLRVLVSPRLVEITELLEEDMHRSVDRALVSLIGLLGIAGVVGLLNVVFIFRPLGRAVMQSQRALSVQRDRAVKAAEAKRDFLSTMSHELRTPMNGVLGLASLLLASELRPEQRRQVELIRSSGQTLLALVNDMLDLSRMEVGALQFAEQAFELEAVVGDVLALAGAHATGKGLETAVFIDPRLPQTMTGDPDRVRQILTNLVGNAVKFTDRGAVTIEARRLDEAGPPGRVMVELAVSDTGRGIAAAQQDRIFERFTRVGHDGRESGEGSGLGLAICRELAERMGGAIRVESEPGRGTTFRVRLPLGAADASPDGAGEQRERASAALDGRRALLVGQMPLCSAVVRRQLEGWGFRVDETRNEPEARRMLEAAEAPAQAYTVAILDDTLANGDLAELARRLQCNARFAKPGLLFAVTDGTSAADRIREAGLGIVLGKPLMPRALLPALARLSGAEPGALSAPDQPLTDPRGHRILLATDHSAGCGTARHAEAGGQFCWDRVPDREDGEERGAGVS